MMIDQNLSKTNFCHHCKKEDQEMKNKYCSRCKKVRYCDATCQKQDWPKHKLECKAPSREIQVHKLQGDSDKENVNKSTKKKISLLINPNYDLPQSKIRSYQFNFCFQNINPSICIHSDFAVVAEYILYGICFEQNKEFASLLCQELSEAGNKLAEGMLAYYGFGTGKKDQVKAYNIFSQAINNKETKTNEEEAFCLTFLARCYLTGNGVKADSQMGMQLMEKACQFDYPPSLYFIAKWYESRKQYDKAIQLYKRAAELGSSEAMHSMGELHDISVHGKFNLDIAIHYFSQAVMLNFPPSLYKMGYINYNLKKDYQKAFECYLAAAERNFVHAMNNVANHYRHGLGVKRDINKAVYWYEKGSEMNDVVAMVSLAHILLNENEDVNIKRDIPKAINLFKKASRLNYPIAMIDLSGFYLMGFGVEKNVGESVRLLEAAAHSGSSDAMLLVGKMYFNGLEDELQPDKKKALFWFKRAAKLGRQEAKTCLEELFNIYFSK